MTESARLWAQRLGPGFDIAALERLMALDPGGETGLMVRLLSVFERSLGDQIAAMEQALSATDAQAVRRAAHVLRSASASLGVQDFTSSCAELEQRAHASSGTPSPSWDEGLSAMAQAWCVRARALRARLQSASEQAG